MSRRAVFRGPLGPLTVEEREGAIAALQWGEGAGEGSALLDEALAQLAAYLDRRLTRFDLPLRPLTGFAADLRRQMLAIPYGETRTYGDLARVLGVSAQAVGQGCGANPLPVLVPCHRVVGASGLGGFSARGGIETKVALLRLEGAASLLL